MTAETTRLNRLRGREKERWWERRPMDALHSLVDYASSRVCTCICKHIAVLHWVHWAE